MRTGSKRIVESWVTIVIIPVRDMPCFLFSSDHKLYLKRLSLGSGGCLTASHGYFCTRVSSSAMRNVGYRSARLLPTLGAALLYLLSLLRSHQGIRLLLCLLVNLLNLLVLLLGSQRSVLADCHHLFAGIAMNLLHLLPHGALNSCLLQAWTLAAALANRDPCAWHRRGGGLRRNHPWQK